MTKASNDNSARQSFDRIAFRYAADDDQMRFARYLEFVLFNGDPRTVLPSFTEWVNDGKPDAPSLMVA